MKRRDFLTRLAGGLAATSLGREGEKPWAAPVPPGDKRQRIGISTYSLHRYFGPRREKDSNLPGNRLNLLDFPEMIADRYKVHHVEAIAPHFASTEPSYLRELKSRLRRSHSRVVNITVDIKEIRAAGGLSSLDKDVRDRTIEASKKWIDVARELRASSVRCDPGKMNPQDLTPTIESYKQLAAYGKSKGIHVIIENHGGVGSEHPEELVKLIEAVGGDFIGALPDFGNFPDDPTRERGLALLFPFAHMVCHAKRVDFDPSGNEVKLNVAKCVEISKQAGFKGIYSIEHEGPSDPYEGIQKLIDELLKCL